MTAKGLLEIMQTGLIDHVLQAIGLDSKLATNQWTPTEAKPLVKDEKGKLLQGYFSHTRMVGMLLYLAGHSCCDIAQAVNCCACYMFQPHLSHEKVMKWIGQHLNATRDRGLILKPSGQLQIDRCGFCRTLRL